MYVDPFWAGVFTTIGIEAVVLLVWAVTLSQREERRKSK
jgi:hypothetical protein